MALSSQRGDPRTSRVAFLAVLALLGAAMRAPAQWGDVALASDRSFDGVILEALGGAELAERIEILSAVARRDDPFIGAYLDAYLLRHASRPAESEHLLRVLLDAAFPRTAALSALAERVAPNRDALLAAAARLDTFADPQLCAAIVRVIPLLAGGRGDLLALLERLCALVRARDGLLDPRQSGLLLDALEAARAIGSPDFLAPVLEAARLSRERVVVERARSVALALAGAGR